MGLTIKTEKDANMANIAEEFIKSKGLEEEYRAYAKERENNANGVKVNFDIMLGDADGYHKDTVEFTNHVLEDFRKYFECPLWGIALEDVQLLDISREWGPGANIYADQLREFFHKLSSGVIHETVCTDHKHSVARFRFFASKEDVADWTKTEYYTETEELDETWVAADFADDLNDFFNDMYFRYVKPYVDDDVFVRANKYGVYGISC